RFVLGIEVSGAVEAVDRASDRAHITLMLRLLRTFAFAAFGRALTRGSLGSRGRLFRLLCLVLLLRRCLLLVLDALVRRFFLLLLLDVLVIGLAEESDALAVRRPHQRARAFGDVGELPRLAAAQRHHENLRLSRLAVLQRRAQEGKTHAVGRPARLRVARPTRHPSRRRRAVRRRRPDRSLVTIALVVDAHARERHSLAIRRDLRISHPEEAEDVFFGDQPLRLRLRERDGDKQEDKTENGNTTSTHRATLLRKPTMIQGEAIALI